MLELTREIRNISNPLKEFSRYVSYVLLYTSTQHERPVLPCCLSRQCTDILQRLYTLRTPVSNSSQGQSDMVAAPAIWAAPVQTAAKHTKTRSMITKSYLAATDKPMSSSRRQGTLNFAAVCLFVPYRVVKSLRDGNPQKLN